MLVDCSHANSNKNYRNQSKVMDYLINNHLFHSNALRGFMLESNLHEGSQTAQPVSLLNRGVSITDGCISLEETETVLEKVYKLK